MKILFYGINYSPELTGIGKYSGEMAQWLAKNDCQLKVITSPPYYPKWKIFKGYKNFYTKRKEICVDVIRCPLYVPKNPTTIKRIIHLSSFAISSFFPFILNSIRWKPKVIIFVAPTIICAIPVILVSKIFKFKTLIHIQDFEIEAIFDLNFIKSNKFKNFALKLEKLILGQFDFVSTISAEMLNKLEEKGIDQDKLIFLPNWTDLTIFKDSKGANFIDEFNICPSKKIILYAGNIGEKQGLENVLYAAREFKDREDIFFVIVGDGAAKNRLIELSNKLELDNLKFLPLMPLKKLPSMLKAAHCHLIVQKNSAADLVLPSKLTNILAVGGNCLITSKENTSLGKFCMHNTGIATLIKPDSTSELVDGISRCLELPKKNTIAEKFAYNNLSIDLILRKFLSDLNTRL